MNKEPSAKDPRKVLKLPETELHQNSTDSTDCECSDTECKEGKEGGIVIDANDSVLACCNVIENCLKTLTNNILFIAFSIDDDINCAMEELQKDIENINPEQQGIGVDDFAKLKNSIDTGLSTIITTGAKEIAEFYKELLYKALAAQNELEDTPLKRESIKKIFEKVGNDVSKSFADRCMKPIEEETARQKEIILEKLQSFASMSKFSNSKGDQNPIESAFNKLQDKVESCKDSSLCARLIKEKFLKFQEDLEEVFLQHEEYFPSSPYVKFSKDVVRSTFEEYDDAAQKTINEKSKEVPSPTSSLEERIQRSGENLKRFLLDPDSSEEKEVSPGSLEKGTLEAKKPDTEPATTRYWSFLSERVTKLFQRSPSNELEAKEPEIKPATTWHWRYMPERVTKLFQRSPSNELEAKEPEIKPATKEFWCDIHEGMKEVLELEFKLSKEGFIKKSDNEIILPAGTVIQKINTSIDSNIKPLKSNPPVATYHFTEKILHEGAIIYPDGTVYLPLTTILSSDGSIKPVQGGVPLSDGSVYFSGVSYPSFNKIGFVHSPTIIECNELINSPDNVIQIPYSDIKVPDDAIKIQDGKRIIKAPQWGEEFDAVFATNSENGIKILLYNKETKKSEYLVKTSKGLITIPKECLSSSYALIIISPEGLTKVPNAVTEMPNYVIGGLSCSGAGVGEVWGPAIAYLQDGKLCVKNCKNDEIIYSVVQDHKGFIYETKKLHGNEKEALPSIALSDTEAIEAELKNDELNNVASGTNHQDEPSSMISNVNLEQLKPAEKKCYMEGCI